MLYGYYYIHLRDDVGLICMGGSVAELMLHRRRMELLNIPAKRSNIEEIVLVEN